MSSLSVVLLELAARSLSLCYSEVAISSLFLIQNLFILQSFFNVGASVSVVGRRSPDEKLAKAKFIQKDLSLMRNAEALAREVAAESLDIIVFTNGIIAAPTREGTVFPFFPRFSLI
jgi:hypothetical protein